MKAFIVEWLKGYLYYLIAATFICAVAMGMMLVPPSWMVWGVIAALGLPITTGSTIAKIRMMSKNQAKAKPGELPPKYPAGRSHYGPF